MRLDKEKAFELRRAGKSYRKIQMELGVSRGTLVAWFRHIEWSKHIKTENQKGNYKQSIERFKELNSSRKRVLEHKYRQAEEVAIFEYEHFRKDPLFWAGLMVFAGEGNKKHQSQIRVTNAEFQLHKIFIQFANKYLKYPKFRIKCGLILYPEMNESLCKEMWSNILDLPRENFHKTQVIKGKETAKRLQYGVAISIISSTELKIKLMKWLSLAQDERFT